VQVFHGEAQISKDGAKGAGGNFTAMAGDLSFATSARETPDFVSFSLVLKLYAEAPQSPFQLTVGHSAVAALELAFLILGLGVSASFTGIEA